MKRALELSQISKERGDIPIAALIVDAEGSIISEAHNTREIEKDPTAHAEILVLREAALKLKAWRLVGCTLVVSLEPCVMCAGAASLARVDRIVYGAKDPRAGAVGSLYKIHEDKKLNHTMIAVPGVLEKEASEQIKNFFKSKRI